MVRHAHHRARVVDIGAMSVLPTTCPSWLTPPGLLICAGSMVRSPALQMKALRLAAPGWR
jgi:hypothetical protein